MTVACGFYSQILQNLNCAVPESEWHLHRFPQAWELECTWDWNYFLQVLTGDSVLDPIRSILIDILKESGKDFVKKIEVRAAVEEKGMDVSDINLTKAMRLVCTSKPGGLWHIKPCPPLGQSRRSPWSQPWDKAIYVFTELQDLVIIFSQQELDWLIKALILSLWSLLSPLFLQQADTMHATLYAYLACSSPACFVAWSFPFQYTDLPFHTTMLHTSPWVFKASSMWKGSCLMHISSTLSLVHICWLIHVYPTLSISELCHSLSSVLHCI